MTREALQAAWTAAYWTARECGATAREAEDRADVAVEPLWAELEDDPPDDADLDTGD